MYILEKSMIHPKAVTKRLLIFVLIAILYIPIVMLIFRLSPDRLTAGYIAGAGFVLIGVALFWGLKSLGPQARWTRIAAFIHLFGISLPLLIFRSMNSGVDFKDIHIMGIPGPVFHQVSTWVYLIMIVAGVLELAFAYKKQKSLQL